MSEMFINIKQYKFTMIKKLIMLISLIVFSNSIFAVPNTLKIDDCNNLLINEENYLIWANNKTLEDINGEIIEYMFQKDLTEKVEFFINFEDETLKIFYENETPFNQISDTLGDYGSNEINIYLPNILNALNNTGFETNADFKKISYNTLIHEITHYFDLEYKNKVFLNRNLTFFPRDYEDREILNETEFEFLKNAGNYITNYPAVRPVLQDSVDFFNHWRFNYAEFQYITEMIARSTAVCINFDSYNHSSFNISSVTPYYCNSYNWDYVNTSYYDRIGDVMLKTFFLENYPEQNYLIKSEDSFCKLGETTTSFFGTIKTILNEMTKLFIESLIPLMFISLMTGLIFIIISNITHIIKNRTKLK